jgi:hypothetical protein
MQEKISLRQKKGVECWWSTIKKAQEFPVLIG